MKPCTLFDPGTCGVAVITLRRATSREVGVAAGGALLSRGSSTGGKSVTEGCNVFCQDSVYYWEQA